MKTRMERPRAVEKSFGMGLTRYAFRANVGSMKHGFKPVLRSEVRRLYDNIATGTAARVAREAAGLTQRVVAVRMGYTIPYVSDLELGKRAWRDALVEAYNAALETGRAG